VDEEDAVAAHTHDTPAACAFYDGDCRVCIALAKRFEGVLARRDIALRPLQTEGTAALFGVTQDRLLAEMRLRLGEGRIFGGARCGHGDRTAYLVGMAVMGAKSRAGRNAADTRHLPIDRTSSRLRRWSV
jgi:hypothetical protein